MGHFLATYLKVLIAVWLLTFFGAFWALGSLYRLGAVIALVITVAFRAYMAQEERIGDLEKQVSDLRMRLNSLEEENTK